MTRQLAFRVLLVVGLTTSVTRHIQAQQNVLLVGVEGAAYQTRNPHGGMAAFGAMAGLERSVTDQFSLRASATALRGARVADDTAVCLIAPDRSCLPRPVFPLWLTSVEVLGVYTPVRGVPARIIAGGGISIAGDARRPYRSSSALQLETGIQALWRAGLDVTLGSSRHAPRIQFTRSGFSTQPFSLSAVDAISIVLRP